MTDFPAAGIKPSHELAFQLNRSIGGRPALARITSTTGRIGWAAHAI